MKAVGCSWSRDHSARCILVLEHSVSVRVELFGVQEVVSVSSPRPDWPASVTTRVLRVPGTGRTPLP